MAKPSCKLLTEIHDKNGARRYNEHRLSASSHDCDC